MSFRSKFLAGLAVLAVAGSLAGTAAASPAQAVTMAGSVAHGQIHPDGHPELCVTANTPDPGAIVHLDLCQAVATGRQDWSIIFIRPTIMSRSGYGLACLSAHAHICIGAGPLDSKTHVAAVALYDHSKARPAALVHNAISLYRTTLRSKGQGYKIGADALFGGYRMTTLRGGRAGVRFGQQLVWKKNLGKADLSGYVFPRFHPVK